jgi:phosphoribosylamine-glycine ligase
VINAPAVIKPRKFLFLSHGGDADALALRVQQEDNQVLLYHFKAFARERQLYAGLIPQPQNVQAGLRWNPDVVIFDQVGEGTVADRIRSDGFAVWGGSAVMDKMENDRAFGLKLMKQAGIRIPETHVFKTAAEAMPFIDEHRTERWVLKPLARAATASTYPSKNAEDLVHFLEKWSTTDEAKQPFLLQRFMDGIEISTEVWVEHGEIVWPANATLEEKRFGVGGLGPNIGCSSSLVYGYQVDDPILVQRGIGKLAAWLKKNDYHGVLDLNSIVNPDDRYPYGLEWTARMGFSAIYALAEVTDGEIGRVLYEAAKGTLKRYPIRPGLGYSVRVSIQPYPANELFEDEMYAKVMEPAGAIDIRIPIGDPHVWPLDVRLDENGNIETAGYDGVICELTARGQTIEEARDAVRRTFDLIEIPNAYARLADGADRALADTTRLRMLGLETFASPMAKSA